MDSAVDVCHRAAALLDEFHPAAALSVLSGEDVYDIDEDWPDVDDLSDADDDWSDADGVMVRALRVQALWMLRRVDEAEEILSALVETAGDNAYVQAVRGQVALGLRDDPALLDGSSGACRSDFATAEQAFDSALRLDPGCVPAIRGRVTVLRLRREYAAADQVLDQAIAEIGTYAGLLVERALIAGEQWRMDDAHAALRAAVTVEPGCVEAWDGLAVLLGSYLGRHDEAIACLTELRSATGSESPEIDENIGWRYYFKITSTSDLDRRASYRASARMSFEATLAKNPAHVAARCGLVLLDYATLGADPAIAAFHAILADAPDSPQAQMLYASLLTDTTDRLQERLEIQQRVYAAAPYLYWAWSAAIYTAAWLGDIESAGRAWQGARQLFPDHPETLRAGAYLATAQGRPDRGLELAEQAIRLAPNESLNHSERANALLAFGYGGEASDPDDPLAEAIGRWPGDVGLRWQKLLRAEGEGRLHEAFAQARVIVALDPHDLAAQERVKTLKKSMRWRLMYRRRGRQTDAEALTSARLTPGERSTLGRFVAAEKQLETRRRLRELAWAQARLRSRETAYDEDWGWFAVLLPLVMLAILWIEGPFGHGGVWWNVGRLALGVVTYAAVWAILISASRVAVTVMIMLILGLTGWAVSPGSGGLRTVLRAGVVLPVLLVGLLLLLMYGHYRWTELRHRRAERNLPHSVLLRELLRLREMIEQYSSRWTGQHRLELANTLDAVARAQSEVLRRTTTSTRNDPELAAFAARRAAGVAAATRDLKRRLVVWNPSTSEMFRRRVDRLLDAAVRGEWGRFPYLRPAHLPQRLRLRSRTAIQLLVTSGVVLAGVWLVVQSRQNPEGPNATLAAIAGLIAAAAPILVPVVQHVTGNLPAKDAEARPVARRGRARRTEPPPVNQGGGDRRVRPMRDRAARGSSRTSARSLRARCA